MNTAYARLAPATILAVALGVATSAFCGEAILEGQTRIVFNARVDGQHHEADETKNGDYEIFSMRPDGSGLVRLTNDDMDHRGPQWSGGRVVWMRGSWTDTEEHPWELWIMQADGSNQRRLVGVPAGARGIFYPSIGPKGRRIYYTAGWRNQEHQWTHIPFVLDLRTGRSTRLTVPADMRAGASWSPDGESLIFAAGDCDSAKGNNPGNYRIEKLNLATGKLRTLLAAEKGRWRYAPVLSPKGDRLAFQQTPFSEDGECKAGNREFRVLDLTSGKLSEPLASVFFDASVGFNFQLRWSPDAKWLYFHRSTKNEEYCFETTMYRVRTDGSGKAEEVGGLPRSEWRGCPSVAVVRSTAQEIPKRIESPMAPLEVKLSVLRASTEEADLAAKARGAEGAVVFSWKLTHGESCAALSGNGPKGSVQFHLPSPCEVEVTAVDSLGRKASANCVVQPRP